MCAKSLACVTNFCVKPKMTGIMTLFIMLSLITCYWLLTFDNRALTNAY